MLVPFRYFFPSFSTTNCFFQQLVCLNVSGEQEWTYTVIWTGNLIWGQIVECKQLFHCASLAVQKTLFVLKVFVWLETGLWTCKNWDYWGGVIDSSLYFLNTIHSFLFHLLGVELDLWKNSKIQCNFFNNFISQTHGECGLHFESTFVRIYISW